MVLDLVEDSEGALVFLYKPWATDPYKKLIPLGMPVFAVGFLLLMFFEITPYPWIALIIMGWALLVTVMITGDMHRDWYWRFDRQTNEAVKYCKRADHLKSIHIPILWPRLGETRRIPFSEISDVLLEDRRIHGFPEYRIMMILDGDPDDPKNQEPIIWAFKTDKKVIDWAEKVKATVFGGSLKV